MSDNDIVYFELPNGEKVSNDPRFKLAEMRQRMLDSQLHDGYATPHPSDVQVASVPDQSVLDNRVRGIDLQHADREHAEERGLLDPEEKAARTPQGVDSNEAVEAERERRAEEAAEAAEADEERLKSVLEADSEEEEPEDDFSTMSAEDLKAEAKKRSIELKGSGIRTKRQLRAALREHDAQNQ